MVEKDLIKIFIDEIYSKPPRKNCPNKKILYNLIDEIWSIDIVDMVDYKSSHNKGFRYIFIITDTFRKDLWCIPINNKSSKKITDDFSNILTKSNYLPLKQKVIEAQNFIRVSFNNFLKLKLFTIALDSQIKLPV